MDKSSKSAKPPTFKVTNDTGSDHSLYKSSFRNNKNRTLSELNDSRNPQSPPGFVEGVEKVVERKKNPETTSQDDVEKQASEK